MKKSNKRPLGMKLGEIGYRIDVILTDFETNKAWMWGDIRREKQPPEDLDKILQLVDKS